MYAPYGKEKIMKKIYISCNPAQKKEFKNKILNTTKNTFIVENLREADTCLVIGTKTETMKKDISCADEYGIEVKEVGENLINTGVYQSILQGKVKPKSYYKGRGMEL